MNMAIHIKAHLKYVHTLSILLKSNKHIKNNNRKKRNKWLIENKKGNSHIKKSCFTEKYSSANQKPGEGNGKRTPVVLIGESQLDRAEAWLTIFLGNRKSQK